MPKGILHYYLYSNPNTNKPLEEVWADIQDYSAETFPDNEDKFKKKTFVSVVLPPLEYNGTFLKGMYLSQGVDCIQELYPNHKELFIPMATSMWSSISLSEHPDVYLTSYDYPERIEWFKKTYPEKAGKIFIPLLDTDFLNENYIFPIAGTPKDIDVLCISTLLDSKNLHILAKALKIYHEKYGYKLKTTLVTGGLKENFSEREAYVINKMSEAVGGVEKLKEYIKFISFAQYGIELNTLYSRSKCTVLTSIFEGKNRSLSESICCNTPVVVFKDLCKYTRGKEEIFPENAGIYVEEFSAEALAEKLHYMMEHYKEFTPRYGYLKNNSRLKFLNKCIDAIPYYRENLPEYEPGRIQDNIWVSLAVTDNYQMSFMDFLYGASFYLQNATINQNLTKIIDFYYNKFQMENKSI